VLNFKTQIGQCPFSHPIKTAHPIRISTKDWSFKTTDQTFDYVKCECGMYILENPPVPEEISMAYPHSEYSGWKKRSQFVHKIRKINNRKNLKCINIQNNTRVLDYGCGNGELANIIAEQGIHVVAFDFSPAAYKENLLSLRQKKCLPTFTSNPEDIVGFFDVIFMLQVIEHLYDPIGTITKLINNLNPNGLIVIETPTRDGWDSKLSPKEMWGGWHAPRHLHIWNPERLITLSNHLNLEVVEFKYIPSPFLWAETIRCRFKNRFVRKIINSDNVFFIFASVILDLIQILSRSKTSNFRLVLKKKIKFTI
jgi:SAM-dependent methyltransferase